MKLNLCFAFIVFAICTNAQNLKEKADILYTNGNYSKAIETYKSIKNLDDVYDDIAKSYVAIGNYGDALNNYEKAVKSDENNLLNKYDYAKLLSRTKKYKEAKQLFINLIALDSVNPNYYYELGNVLEKQNDSTALDQYMKTFSLDTTHQKVVFKIVSII